MASFTGSHLCLWGWIGRHVGGGLLGAFLLLVVQALLQALELGRGQLAARRVLLPGGAGG